MMTALFLIFIRPLYSLIEVIFYHLLVTSNFNIGLSLFLISFVVSMLCLPLYLNAEKLQEEEEEIQKKLAPRVQSIKKNFKGDERFLLLKTYYKQNNYHPIMGLRLSFSLLLQIPFFLAAYIFFHNLSILSGMQFFQIADLSKPDGLFHIGNFTLNLLPVLMTLINILAGIIYAKDKSFKKNMQLYIMSLIFLVLLYNSPSALVLYWTFNNVFSLLKNIGLRYIKPDKFLNYACIAFVISLYFYLIYAGEYKTSIAVSLLVLLFVPSCFNVDFNKILLKDYNPKNLYFLSCVALWLLFGALIPTNVVSTSSVEFIFPTANATPFNVLAYPFLTAFGIFVVWGGIAYLFASKFLKKVLAFAALCLLSLSLLNMLFVPLPKVDLLASLEFSANNIDFNTLSPVLYGIYLSILILAVILLLCMYLKKKRVLQKFVAIVIITLIIVSGINSFKIYNYLLSYKEKADNISQMKKVFNFSKDKKNVLIIFLDRAISSYFPLILDEKPELKEAYKGFTFYPNTISYAPYTFFGYPPILGGYEYSIAELTKKKDTAIIPKTNEGYSVLPRIFKENGYNVTVTDTPGVEWGYEHLDMYEMYQKYGIHYESVRGALGRHYLLDKREEINEGSIKELASRNLLYFAFMQSSPLNLRKILYNNGRYFNLNVTAFTTTALIENYAELYYLPSFTGLASDAGAFIVMNNDLPHAESILKYPDYTLGKEKNPGNPYGFKNDEYSLKQYHPNAASIILIGRYLKFLDENGVLDNTRIIIVSDHGRDVRNPRLKRSLSSIITPFNCLLLVKDFNSRGDMKISNDFMTNADVPSIALKGLVKNPKNPFTGRDMNYSDKKNGVWVKRDSWWEPGNYCDKNMPILRDSQFYFVKDNIFDEKNWRIDVSGKQFLKEIFK